MLSSESQPQGTRNSKRAPQGKQPSLLSRLSAPVGDEREEGVGGGVVEITSIPIASGDPSRRTRGARCKGNFHLIRPKTPIEKQGHHRSGASTKLRLRHPDMLRKMRTFWIIPWQRVQRLCRLIRCLDMDLRIRQLHT
jgi:hypothetical protein